jgi:hypothetical protein
MNVLMCSVVCVMVFWNVFVVLCGMVWCCVEHPISLISMAKKHGRRESMMAIDALKDLFLSDLLPTDRKLLFFYQQPLTFAVCVSTIHVILCFYRAAVFSCFDLAWMCVIGVG